MECQLLPVLLLLLLGASGRRGQGQGPEEPPPEEDGVLVLTQHSLDRALQEHHALLVEFCECLGPVGWGQAGFAPRAPQEGAGPGHVEAHTEAPG